MKDTATSPEWAKLVLQPDFLAKVDRMALRRFGQPGLAEEASTYVLGKLSGDDWAACRQYSGRAQPGSYLLTLVSHAIEEFSRGRFGRPRPPEWLKREGELWERVWRQICLERQLPQTVIDSLCAEGQREPDFIRDIIRTIKGRLPWCGSSAREIPADCYDCELNEKEQASPALGEQLSDELRETTLQELHRLFFAEDRPSESVMTPTLNWQALRDRLDLTPEERLLLKLAHQQGLKHKQIATMLGMPAYQPGRLLKALHQRIARALRDCDIVSEAESPFEEATP